MNSFVYLTLQIKCLIFSLLFFFFFFFQLQNQIEEYKSDSSKERKLRERAEQYTRELEQEIEGIKRKHLGKQSSPANIELTQEVSR